MPGRILYTDKTRIGTFSCVNTLGLYQYNCCQSTETLVWTTLCHI